MTRKRGRPTPDEVRCPDCGVVAWRRVGERIDVHRVGGERRLVHAFEQGDSHWEWTCARCGHVVRATSVLDNALTRVQPTRVPAIIGGLFGAGAGAAAGAEGSGGAASGGLSGLLQAGAAAVAGIAGVAVIAVAATTFERSAASSPAPTGSPAAASSAATVTELAALTDAGADLAGRRLELDRAEVTRVTGDTTFWLGGGGSEAFVVLDEDQQPEGDVTVRTGQQVRVSGTVHDGPPDGVELTDEDRAALEDLPVYVLADEVEVVEE